MDRDAKVSTVTTLTDLPKVKGQRSSKLDTFSNGKNNSIYNLGMDRDAKVSTVTLLSDLPLLGQRSKEAKF